MDFNRCILINTHIMMPNYSKKNFILSNTELEKENYSNKEYNPEIIGQFVIEPEDVIAIEELFLKKEKSPYLYDTNLFSFINNKEDEIIPEDQNLDIIKINDPTIVWGVGKYYQKVG